MLTHPGCSLFLTILLSGRIISFAQRLRTRADLLIVALLMWAIFGHEAQATGNILHSQHQGGSNGPAGLMTSHDTLEFLSYTTTIRERNDS